PISSLVPAGADLIAEADCSSTGMLSRGICELPDRKLMMFMFSALTKSSAVKPGLKDDKASDALRLASVTAVAASNAPMFMPAPEVDLSLAAVSLLAFSDTV